MVSFHRLLSAIVLTWTSVAFPVSAEPEASVAVTRPASTAAEASVVARGLAEGHAAIISHAMELFSDGGLELPPIEFVGHTDTEACKGKIGGFHRSVGGASVIDICTTPRGTFGLRLMLHEMAHAWVAASLSEATRQEFQELRGWRYWHDYERAEWAENGTEQAAEIVMWGLIDRPIRMTKLDDASCDALHTGFVLLTGREPLHANSTWCDPVPHAGGPT